ncbi:MAG: aldo/keto reductase [Betaproteobacteria bacterium]|nr:aldo/keto reductase [Betaproteobacteria bacterium]
MLAGVNAPAPLPTVEFADGTLVPALGQGTWTMGEHPARAAREVDVLVAGIELGMTLIDTAEMYADGEAERLVGRAVAGRRDRVFLVSKAYPQNAGRRALVAACERSLARLATDRIDLYLLHWRGRIPLADTVAAFEGLVRAGKILRWGVSNFDRDDLVELAAVPDGIRCATNQVCYHLGARGVEWDLLPWMRKRRMPLIAYSPFGQGALLHDAALQSIAGRERRAAAALALAWVLRQQGVIAIPQTADPAHLVANRRAVAEGLPAATAAALTEAFPAPSGPTPLVVL